MRVRGPYEVKPRLLRALVLLLALLPLIPTTFVLRFLVEDLASQSLEARERARPLYRQSLERTTANLAADFARPLLATSSADDDPRGTLDSLAPADALLRIDAAGNLSLPSPPAGTALSAAVLESGVRFVALPRAGAPRWRYFSELPEPVFALRPAAPADLLLLLTRQHLRERIESFYRRESNSQLAVRLLDENGDGVPLVGGVGPPQSVAPSGEPLAEVALPAPLPAWRAQLFILDPALVEGIARGQVAFYWWSVGGMFLVTFAIAAGAGRILTRRIALHELSNDALAVVSHEMKTPLASTRMFIDTLLERRYRDGTGQADEYLRLIAEENGRLERLVDSFQTLSRLEHRHGRTGLTLKIVCAGEVARAAADRLRTRLEAPGRRFTLVGGDEPTHLRVDHEGLVTVLVNLLDNALKYTGEGQRITLRCRTEKGEVIYEVGDDGPGIAPGEQRRIFERFYQSDRRLSRTYEGVGLGLSIVRGMVRAHGGSVSVKSAPGKGSVFAVRLPAAGD